MKNVVLVAGKATNSIKERWEKSNKVTVVKTFDFTDDLLEDLFDNGGSDYLDVDSIVLVGTGLLPESTIEGEEQLLNLQSAMNLVKVRSKFYFISKDANLLTMYRNDSSKIHYRYFMSIVFSTVDVRALDDVVMGRFDSQGVCLPDFYKRSEIESLLQIESDSELEEAVVEETPTRELFTEYADSEKNMKELRKAELAEKKKSRKLRNEEKKSKSPGLGFFGKKNKEVKVVEAAPVEEKPVPAPKPKPEPKPKEKPAPAPKKEKVKKEKPVREKTKPVKKDTRLKLNRGVVIVTGDRQSGVSTTVANMAEVYAANGMSVLVLDLDMRRRTQTRLFPGYRDAEVVENRVKNALLVNLVRPDNLIDVHAIVEDNIAVVSLSPDVERVITKFAGRPIDKVFNSTAIMNLLSFSKSLFDVVLVDFPLDVVREVGECLSYSDRVVLCMPNTETHLDNFFETEMEELLLENNVVAHTLMTKAKVVLTKYNANSRIDNREATPELVEDILNSLEDVIYHVDVVGNVSYSEDYVTQFDKGKKIVTFDGEIREEFESFMELL